MKIITASEYNSCVGSVLNLGKRSGLFDNRMPTYERVFVKDDFDSIREKIKTNQFKLFTCYEKLDDNHYKVTKRLINTNSIIVISKA